MAIVTLALGLVPASARADGDPASDVLVSQSAFVPWGAGVSASASARLQALLAAAARSGYPARVALIASATDLGSVTQLWEQPQTYADYLGVELSQTFGGSVVVVMPDGVGVYHPGLSAALARSALERSRARSGRGDLAVDAAAAVQALAAAAGHAVRAPAAPPAPARAAPRATDVTAWLVFAAGAVLIALAWAASLRARPLGVHLRGASFRGAPRR